MTERNFTQRFDVDYPAGRFDLSLNLIDGNPLIYRFFDTKVYFSIYRLLEPEEQEKLSAIAKACLDSPGKRIDECVHILNGDITDCYVISIQKTDGEESYDVEFLNITQNKNILNDLNDRIAIARDYLTLNGQAVFTYTHDNNNFHLFIINGNQNIDLFDMNFDEWAQKMMSDSIIAHEDFEAFEAFCDIVKGETVDHVCSFRGNVLNEGSAMEKYKITLKSKQYDNNRTVVLGTWSVINEFTDDVENTAIEASYIDALTGLLNKKAIMQYAEKAVENAATAGNQVALAIMDVDNFKSVNDNYGHLFGDHVIKAVGEVIKEAVGTDATAGRMGGDEFLIVFEKFTDELEYRNVLRCIKTKVGFVYQNKFGADNKLTCSIGLGRYGYGSCSTTYHDLFKIADRALYLAKQKGKNRYIIYKPEIHGDFNSPDDNGDIVNITTKYYSENDIDKLNILLSDTIIYGSEIINDLLEQLASILMTDQINIFILPKTSPDFMYSASNDIKYVDCAVLNNKHYLSLFTRDRLVISNIHGIEYTLPDIYKSFSDSNISSLMQYLIRDKKGHISGLISAEISDRFTAFPKIAVQLFENASRTINSVLIREERI